MTRGALGENLLAGSRIRAREERTEVRPRIGATFFGLAFDEIARFDAFRQFAGIGMEKHARRDGGAQRHDSSAKDPACSGVETIVHYVNYPAKFGWSDGCAPL